MIKLPVREWSLSLPTSQPDIGTGATRLRHLLGMYYYGHCTLAAPAGVTAAARGWGRLSAVTSSSYQWNEAEPGEEKNILAHMVRSGVANRWRRPRAPSGQAPGETGTKRQNKHGMGWDVSSTTVPQWQEAVERGLHWGHTDAVWRSGAGPPAPAEATPAPALGQQRERLSGCQFLSAA